MLTGTRRPGNTFLIIGDTMKKIKGIPYGEIIAKPLSNGGYDILMYEGKSFGWTLVGQVDSYDEIKIAVSNLKREIVII